VGWHRQWFDALKLGLHASPAAEQALEVQLMKFLAAFSLLLGNLFVKVNFSGWVAQGPEVAAFEREFAAAVDASHAVAVST
jgi:hypothetical protein